MQDELSKHITGLRKSHGMKIFNDRARKMEKCFR